MNYDIDAEISELKNAWKDHIDELHLLFSIAKEISFSRNLDLLLDQLVTRTAQVLRAEAASLFLLNPDTNMLDFTIVKGQSSQAIRNLKIHLKPGEGIAGWVAAYGRAALCNNPQEDPRFKADVDHMTGFATRNLLAVPLTAHDKNLGVIEIINKLDGKEFTEYDVEFLRSIAWLATMALENAQAYKALETSQDYLAGILENLPGGFIGINEKNRVTYCNTRALEILKISPSVVGQGFAGALADFPAFIQAVEKTLTGNEPVRRQSFTVDVPSRGHRQIGYSTMFIRTKSGDPQGVGIQFQDITEFLGC